MSNGVSLREWAAMRLDHPCEDCGLDEGHVHQLNAGTVEIRLCKVCSPECDYDEEDVQVANIESDMEGWLPVESEPSGFQSASEL